MLNCAVVDPGNGKGTLGVVSYTVTQIGLLHEFLIYSNANVSIYMYLSTNAAVQRREGRNCDYSRARDEILFRHVVLRTIDGKDEPKFDEIGGAQL